MTSQKCTKAIIAVAGYGTRRLPITKAIEKCLIPIGNRPIVDYVVEDCLKAGIREIIFVVGEQSEQIRTYYGQNLMLEEYLLANGKHEALDGVRKLTTKADFHFVVQDRDQPYGTSTPVWLAKSLIEPGERFLYLYGDNIYYNDDGSSAIAAFLQDAESAGAKRAMMAVEVPHDQVIHYGIVATEQRNGHEMFQTIIEKPKPEEAPSNLNNAGCFMVDADILPFVEKSITDAPQKEKYFTDAVNWYAKAGHDLAVIRTKGEYIDCGTVPGWLYANNRIAGGLPRV